MNMHWEHLDGGSYMKRRKWALLAVLLGMMVVVSGCFGGGSRVATGGVMDMSIPRTTQKVASIAGSSGWPEAFDAPLNRATQLVK